MESAENDAVIIQKSITEAGRRVQGLKLAQVKQIITQLKTLIASLQDFEGWADYADMLSQGDGE